MSQLKARILLWGIAGSGKTTTLKTIHAKLRSDLRGDLRYEPARLDPSVRYEALPITLGDVGGVGTQIEIIAVPGAEDLAMTRKHLLDEVDGLVLVLDCSPERIESNAAAIDELRTSLASYGRRLDSFPIVLQYNKRDIADPFAIEALHRKIGLSQAAVFETIATTGHGVLATLTTISKHVVRTRRVGAESAPPAPPPEPAAQPESPESEPIIAAEPMPLPGSDAHDSPDDASLDTSLDVSSEDASASSHDILEAAILAEGEAFDDLLDGEGLGAPVGDDTDFGTKTGGLKPEEGLGNDLRIVSVGQASLQADGAVRLPLVLGDDSGQSRSVVLSLRLDALTAGVED